MTDVSARRVRPRRTPQDRSCGYLSSYQVRVITSLLVGVRVRPAPHTGRVPGVAPEFLCVLGCAAGYPLGVAQGNTNGKRSSEARISPAKRARDRDSPLGRAACYQPRASARLRGGLAQLSVTPSTQWPIDAPPRTCYTQRGIAGLMGCSPCAGAAPQPAGVLLVAECCALDIGSLCPAAGVCCK